MNSNSRILMTAEPYGFGPSSKALAIARELAEAHGMRAYFTGLGTAYSAATREAELFSAISTSARYDTDLLAEEVRGHDLVISVMEPSLALAAAAEEVPCLYVDSLFWMWDWPDEFADLEGPQEQQIRRITEGTRQQRRGALREAINLPMHEAQYVAHRVAAQVCYQRYGGEAEPTRSRARDACAAKPTGAIVDRVPAARQLGGDSPALIVSVSGLSNEFTEESYATGWTRAVIDTIADAIKGTAFEGSGTRVGGNADILDTLSVGADRSLEIKPWHSHEDFMLDLSRAAAFAAPPGITSIAESWAIGVPFFALPIQHYAHASILQRMRGSNADAFPGIDAGATPTTGDLVDVTATVLNSVIADLLEGGRARTAAVDHVREFLVGLAENRTTFIARQDLWLSQLFGSADGASEVVREAHRLC
ncbi:hypothetical protein [Streptomyces doebereineriae]|uniref:Glycosyltransferase n=1 Tax=Streptomyces doebereineriae TaxID=3075528 RepID=A0ABU2V8W8_9ACTN|nr:hypothetical protein [Streptomyces sp. DSM 41640]MDT0481889.1 hypothetical protein [Streptomyces sp. DSM 41640]